MQTFTFESLDQNTARLMAEMRKLNAETLKLQGEFNKFYAESAKLQAEAIKLTSEAGKISKDVFWYPMAVATGVVATVATVTATVIKLLT